MIHTSRVKFPQWYFVLIFCFLFGNEALYAQTTLPEPVFSHPAGMYSQDFQLTLSTPIGGAVIRYTLDGSTPTGSSPLFSGSIHAHDRTYQPNVFSVIPTNDQFEENPDYRENFIAPTSLVFKATVVRARLFADNSEPGPVVTRTYIVSSQGADRFQFPVLSLVTDSENLFDPDSGIYVPGNFGNYYQRGDAWERSVHVEFFENDGSPAFALTAGMRIHGGTSRNRPRKAFRIYARGDEYGTPWIQYQMFPDKPVQEFKRLIVRNSGNDWSESILRDAFHHTLIAGRVQADVMYARPVVVLINGEYWGIHDIRDRFDDNYIYTHYGVEEDDMTMMENDSWFERGDPSGIAHYNAFRNYIGDAGWTGTQEQFEYVNTQIDVNSFIDYQIAHIFFRNTDWPGNHVLAWRKNTGSYVPGAPAGQDGRWRWMIFDTDFGFGLDFNYVNNTTEFGQNDAAHNTLAMALVSGRNNWPVYDWSTFNFRRLMLSEPFRHAFVNRFADLLNTSFKPERVTSVLNAFESAYRPHMAEHIARWGRPATIGYWDEDLLRMHTFGEQRATFLRQHIAQYFLLPGIGDITVDVNDATAGYVHVNSIRIDAGLDGLDNPDAPYPWTGTYFRNNPVRLVAEPRPGFDFTGWTGDVTQEGDTLFINPQTSVSVTANFTAQETFEGDAMNPPAFRLLVDDVPQRYAFDAWDPEQAEGTFPPHTVFQQSRMNDPGLDDAMTDPYYIPYTDENTNEYHANDQDKIGFPYKLTGRTRLNGLGDEGISLINTGRGRDLGAVVVAIDTRPGALVSVSWKASTLVANSREYAIRLQYRVGLEGAFTDLLNGNTVIEYKRNPETGVEEEFFTLLPEDAWNQPYVQLRWKFYYTGVRNDAESGARDMLRLDDISVGWFTLSTPSQSRLPARVHLHQNYPNPFNPTTRIRYELGSTQPGPVRLAVYDLLGREVAVLVDEVQPPGSYTVQFHAASLSSGIYLYRIETPEAVINRTMILLK